MITVFGGQTSRSIRVVWLLEEMGLPYRVRQVDMLSDVPDTEFLAANPANYIPVLVDGDVTMVESIAILQYLMGRYGPTPLAPAPDDPGFPAYLQFLHLGEAGLATLLMTPVVARFMAPESERDNWSARQGLAWAEKRMRLVRAQLARAPYMAGEAFTAADISVTYALEFGRRQACLDLGEAETAYLDRTLGREAYKRAYARSHEGVAA
ncbi:glutathione S-transferase family protein [Phenylobacterium sp. J367]|uniref:glutathione S-transferase family protein n=1 Tax=Phenylobacterium sp. J367 TaxID=2898435 RepID=UPI002151B800|nr:glutathione S-transferase family protein [Phenylobacterium sp. J367]MCR5877500.1 glutathione S-transferase family protein [Phenylobacterium sp. J367]